MPAFGGQMAMLEAMIGGAQQWVQPALVGNLGLAAHEQAQQAAAAAEVPPLPQQPEPAAVVIANGVFVPVFGVHALANQVAGGVNAAAPPAPAAAAAGPEAADAHTAMLDAAPVGSGSAAEPAIQACPAEQAAQLCAPDEEAEHANAAAAEDADASRDVTSADVVALVAALPRLRYLVCPQAPLRVRPLFRHQCQKCSIGAKVVPDRWRLAVWSIGATYCCSAECLV